MLNRRQLRIKALQSLYAYYQHDQRTAIEGEKEMRKSIDKIYELYLSFLLVFGEIKHLAEKRIDDNKSKKLPSEEDLNPNLKFVQNEVICYYASNEVLRKMTEERKINWTGAVEQEIIKKVFRAILDAPEYHEYMELEGQSFKDDQDFVVTIFKEYIANNESLLNYWEEESIFWMDDIDFVCSAVIRSIKNINVDKPKSGVFSLYKNKEDDEAFVRDLYHQTIKMDSDNAEIIDQLTKNWELDRIARMDVILMKMALTELKFFESIPKKVTLNEYIEISKFYSTPRSNSFINGILDKAVALLEKDGKIKKVGRGLMN